MRRTEIRHWLASGDALTARLARRSLREVKRTVGRLRSGSLTAEMDRIVAGAMDSDRGTGLSIGPDELSRRRRAAAARALGASSEPQGCASGTAEREHRR